MWSMDLLMYTTCIKRLFSGINYKINELTRFINNFHQMIISGGGLG